MKAGTLLSPRFFFLLGISSILIGLSVSKPLISTGQIIILITWLFSGSIKDRIRSFYLNKTAVFISSIYLLTLFGLIYTSNFDYAWGDVRRKMAFLSLPFLIAGFSPITNSEWKLLFKVYVGAVLTASFWSFFVFCGGLGIEITDVREYSRFNSHIRFGLEICFAIFGAVYFLLKEKKNTQKIGWLLIITWFISFLYLISLFTGIIVFGVTSIILFLFIGLSFSKKWVKYTVLLGALSLFGFVFITLLQTLNDYQEQQTRLPLDILTFSSSGEHYFHENQGLRVNEKENGYYVWKNIAWHELENEWNKKSEISFSEKDLKNQDIAVTIIRYITSKGLYKNAESVHLLSSEDISNIEKGITSFKYPAMNNVQKRLHNIIWELNNYQSGLDINGHSVIMRWEYWKTAYRIFKQNLWIGVGTGDLQDAFNSQYEKDNSQLLPQYRLRAHNQYITYAVTFGVLGIICFALFLIYPFLKHHLYRDFTYLAFFSIVTISMLAEDTLETQVGINFFVLFNTLLLLKEKAVKN